MPDNLIGFSGLMLEDDIIKKLISDHFDGVMLLECATGKIVYINDWMGGSLQRLVGPGGTPHDERKSGKKRAEIRSGYRVSRADHIIL